MASRRHHLARRRRAVGLSQEQFAERLGIERSTVARWEAGETEPQPWLRPKIAIVLQVSIDQLDELINDASPDLPEDERLIHAFEHPAGVDLVAVARLREHVHALDRRYNREPSTALLAEAGQCLGQVGSLRAHAAASLVRRELVSVDAQAAILMGQLVWDASQRRNHITAHTYLDRAIGAAQQLGDPVLEGLALLRKSFVALYGEKDASAGLKLTMRTAETTKRTSPVLTGLAILHAAEAQALLGRQHDCEQALSDAEGQFERIGITDAAIDLFSPTHYGRLAGSCYLSLDKASQAQRILEDTAAELQDGSKSQAIVLGNLALANARQGRLDEAAAALNGAIDVVRLNWGGGGLNVVFTAGRELRPWRHIAAVQDVYDRLLALMAAA